MARPLYSVTLHTISALRRLVDLLLFVATIGWFALLVLQFRDAPQIEHLWITRMLHHLGDPPIATVHHWLALLWPSSWAVHVSTVLLAIATIVIRGWADTTFEYLHKASSKLVPRVRPVSAMPEMLNAESERSREALLRKYREIEQALKSAARKHCTFLSIDIVGSTQMKVGENATAVAATFQAYEELVRDTLASYGAWKDTWTPDGVMICFLEADLAVEAAKRLLYALRVFNDHDNQLRTPIIVRCGANAGDVSIFEDTRLEKVADRAIDIAGHMQKNASPGSLWIGNELYEELTDKSEFTFINVEVDGQRVYAWLPRRDERAEHSQDQQAIEVQTANQGQ